MTVLLVVLGSIPRGVCLDPRFLSQYTSPRLNAELPGAELQEKIPYYSQRLVVKPGITGWAQVRYGYGATLEDAIEKLQFDLYYIKNMSFFLDMLIILSTAHKVLFAKVALQTNAK
jgi:lipopolysaccharide/colanic/teichoic acid biosynthesis glycosyltransferase